MSSLCFIPIAGFQSCDWDPTGAMNIPFQITQCGCWCVCLWRKEGAGWGSLGWPHSLTFAIKVEGGVL